ncbi:hypothetical protein N7490_009750 [Penicillium lividum]|nr:hypothetical protein N7490_009750 [Penicillium lividum]
MVNVYNGMSCLSGHDHALARFLKAGVAELANVKIEDKGLRRFFLGLNIDFSWEETFLLLRGILAAFGVKETDWKALKLEKLEKKILAMQACDV